MGEEAFFHAGEEDERELEALGGVEGHEGDAGFGGVLVGVGDEGGVVEEFGEGFAAGRGVLRGVGEFLQVLDAGEGFGRGFVFEGADVAGAVVEELDELGEGGGVAGLAEGARVGFVGGFVLAGLASTMRSRRSRVASLADCLRGTGAKGLKWLAASDPTGVRSVIGARFRGRWWRFLRWGRSRSRS